MADGRILPSLNEFIQMSLTFMFVVIGWIIFRANTIMEAGDYLGRMISPASDFFDLSLFMASGSSLSGYNVLISVISVLLMLGVEWIQRDMQYGLDILHLSGGMKWVTCVSLCLLIYVCHADTTACIYFQF